MKKNMTYLIGFLFIIITSSPLWAGNKAMIENRIDELDKLNKEAVSRIAGQPESGKINIKVRVIPEKDGYRFEAFDKETTASMPDNYLSQDSGDKFFTFREGIARLVHKKPSITPYKIYSNDGEYTSFKDAITKLSRSKK